MSQKSSCILPCVLRACIIMSEVMDMMKHLAWMAVCMLVLLAFSCAMAEEVFYVLEYDGNGGSSGISAQAIYPGETITLSNSTASWSGHYFLGWATTPDAETAEYQPKDSFTADHDTTLYAVWMECPDIGVVSQSQNFTFTYPV